VLVESSRQLLKIDSDDPRRGSRLSSCMAADAAQFLPRHHECIRQPCDQVCFGLGPAKIVAGDKVVILWGCSMPIVLRLTVLTLASWLSVVVNVIFIGIQEYSIWTRGTVLATSEVHTLEGGEGPRG